MKVSGMILLSGRYEEKKEAEAELPAPWIVAKHSDNSLTVGIAENKTNNSCRNSV